MDDLKAAGYDTDFALDSDPKALPDRLNAWMLESNTLAKEAYERTVFNETVTQVCGPFVCALMCTRRSDRDVRLCSVRVL